MADWTQYNDAQKAAWNSINRIEAAERVLVPILRKALSKRTLTPEMRQVMPEGCETLLDVFHRDHTINFMRMGSFLRLGATLERFVRAYYMEKVQLTTTAELREDLTALGGGFEPFVFRSFYLSPARSHPTVVDLYARRLGINLGDKVGFSSVQEYFIHRALYVHKNGQVDDEYLDQIAALLGKDERDRIEAAIMSVSPVEHVEDAHAYWFEPIDKNLQHYIDRAMRFVLSLHR